MHKGIRDNPTCMNNPTLRMQIINTQQKQIYKVLYKTQREFPLRHSPPEKPDRLPHGLVYQTQVVSLGSFDFEAVDVGSDELEPRIRWVFSSDVLLDITFMGTLIRRSDSGCRCGNIVDFERDEAFLFWRSVPYVVSPNAYQDINISRLPNAGSPFINNWQ